MAIYRLNKMYKLLIRAALGLVIIVSCSKEDRPTPINSTIPNQTLPNIKPKGNENYLKENSDYIYNQGLMS